MRIILTDTVDKLGQSGDVKEVANGYARNFLFPRNLAVPATKGALQEATNRRASAEKRAASQVSSIRAAADRLNGLSVLLYARTGEQNRLYGSITSTDISDALRVQHKQEVDRRRIKLDRPIHRTGNYTATVTLGSSATAQINLVVEPESNRTGALTSVADSAPTPPAPPPEAATAEAATTEAELQPPIGAAEVPTAEAATAETELQPAADTTEAPNAEAATAETEVEPPVGSVEALAVDPVPEAAIEPITGAIEESPAAEAAAQAEATALEGESDATPDTTATKP